MTLVIGYSEIPEFKAEKKKQYFIIMKFIAKTELQWLEAVWDSSNLMRLMGFWDLASSKTTHGPKSLTFALRN